MKQKDQDSKSGHVKIYNELALYVLVSNMSVSLYRHNEKWKGGNVRQHVCSEASYRHKLNSHLHRKSKHRNVYL